MIVRLLCVAALAVQAAACGPGGGAGCPTGERSCDGQCVDTLTDHENCGGCGNACGPDQTCGNGQCSCSSGLTACGQECVNTATDAQNCGGCGTACGANQFCVNSGCGTCMDRELCNGADDDCDGQTDEDAGQACDNACGEGTRECVGGVLQECDAPEPEEEICDEIDNDCDTQIDEDVTTTYYRDSDRDRYGRDDDTVEACDEPAGFVDEGGDCNDSNAAVHPGALEACDDLDNNCVEGVDEGCTCTLGRTRECGEGGDTGVCEWGSQRCEDTGSGPTWGACTGGVRPGTETCDGEDDDCDGPVDEGIAEDGYEGNDTCASARGPLVTYEGDAEPVSVTNATLYSSDGSADQDWYLIRAEELTHLECGWPWELRPQCYFYFTADLTPPAAAGHEGWQMCIQVRYSDTPCAGGPDEEFCTSAGDWDGTSYLMTLVWEGTCWLDDSFNFYVVVRSAGVSAVNDCRPYQASFGMIFTEQDCEE